MSMPALARTVEFKRCVQLSPAKKACSKVHRHAIIHTARRVRPSLGARIRLCRGRQPGHTRVGNRPFFRAALGGQHFRVPTASSSGTGHCRWLCQTTRPCVRLHCQRFCADQLSVSRWHRSGTQQLSGDGVSGLGSYC